VWAPIEVTSTSPATEGSKSHQVLVPATKALLTEGNYLDPAEIGCKSIDDVPQQLKLTGWEPKPEKNREMLEGLLAFDPDKIEDPFDKMYVNYLHMPILWIAREKLLRKELEYTSLLPEGEQEREVVLRHFGNFYGHLMRLVPCRVIRWLNGWVQVTALASFWLTTLVVARTYIGSVLAERWRPRAFFPFRNQLSRQQNICWNDPLEDGKWLTPSEIDEELEALENPELGNNPGTAVLMLRDAYGTYLRGEISSQGYRDSAGAARAVDDVAERRLRQIDSDMSPLVYLGWSLPSLGFVGTVLGLGTALLTAGDMVTPNSELQRDAIQTVSIYLGRAFDKTFVALLLSLVQMALIYGVRWAQESTVLAFQDRIARGLIPRLKN
jgi:hypothetical protein